MAADGQRPLYAGSEGGPESPFPIKLWGPVIKGFGRGSRELGIPTANIPPEGLSAYPDLSSGVYYGFVGLLHHPKSTSGSTSTAPSSSTTSPASPTSASNTSTTDNKGSAQVYPAVLSIGYNPFYNNTLRSVEIHLLHHFHADFYGSSLNLLMLGYIRPERNYDGVDALIADIKFDCDVARRSLERDHYRPFATDQWLTHGWDWTDKVDAGQVEKEVLAQK